MGTYGLDAQKAKQNSTPEQNAKAFYKTQSAIQIAAERTPSLFRCNGSEYTDELLRIAAASGLQAGVEPTSYLNHRSFSSPGNALNYVRKLQRGSIISIKLGQELDSDEYGDPGSELDERPAIDKEPTLTDESLFSDDDTYSNTLNVFLWLLDALQDEQFDVVSIKSLMRSEQDGTSVNTLSKQELSLYNAESYTLPLTAEPLGAALTDAVEDSYFDGAVFIGDSISLRLQTYVEAQREIDPAFFGTARFLTSQGLGIGNSLWQVSADSRHPTYEGSAMAVEDAVAAMDDVTRVYIMLGMNDIQYYDTEDFINNYRTLIYLIRSKTPGVDICIQSITPGTAGRTSVPTNEDIFLYDLALAKLCAEYGYTYIDVASALRDDAGSLPETLCSDAGNLGLHLNESAVEIWIQYLRTHAGAEPD
jgi:lysophospholipase L1-like esterase